ncbi:MAG: 30S ribosomal protein S16 [Myxococcales bacterium SG8_38]|nr:MAG: 30S ribosomal protein S16 [Myxococcales bacterium SG8_38]
MVKVRLARAGAKKRPYYHIVVTDKEKARDGRFIEQIGTYNPSRPIEEATVDYSRLDYWVGVGAKISDRVRDVIKQHKKAAAPSASAS